MNMGNFSPLSQRTGDLCSYQCNVIPSGRAIGVTAQPLIRHPSEYEAPKVAHVGGSKVPVGL